MTPNLGFWASMDLASFYLRTFFGAKPFGSPELDSLAKRMRVLHLMSSNPQDRYFTTDAKTVTAVNLGNKVVFGHLFYERLSEDERLAVSAHEFAHILHHDDRRGVIAVSTLGVSLVLTAAIFFAVHSVLITEVFFCLSFLGLMWIRSSRDADRSRLQELKCDSMAASFVGGQPMISSIRLAESLLVQRSGVGFFRRTRKNGDPTVEERTRAIVAPQQQ
jgi:Zn-dependent protease with chaperone function